MGEIDIEEELRLDNPQAKLIDIHIYANALRAYHEASQNILRNGSICAHPRTGTPIENPYLKVQAQQGAILGKMRKIKSDRVVMILEETAKPHT